MKKHKLILLLTIAISFNLPAQVGINTETPNPHAALDIQSLNSDDGFKPKGVHIPSMSASERNLFITNPADPDIPDGLLIYNTDENCYNYFSKTELSWKSLCGNVSPGGEVNIPDCNNIVVHGRYVGGQQLNINHYLEIPLLIINEGTYEISAIAYQNDGTTSNEYYFMANGEFFYTGDFTINVPGMGTPLTPSGINTPDSIKIMLNGQLLCTVSNQVIDPEARLIYFNCNASQITGNFETGINYDNVQDSYILAEIDVDALADNTPYEIHSDTINGLSFQAEGILNTGTNQIILNSQGIPTRSGEYVFTLYTNIDNNDGTTISCTVPVKVTARQISILNLSQIEYELTASSSYGRGMYGLLQNPDLFAPGQNSVYPVDGFTYTNLRAAISTTDLTNTINTLQPDIILAQQPYYPQNNTYIQILNDYINQGGVLILTCDNNGTTKNGMIQSMVRTVFENNTTMTININLNEIVFPINSVNTLITNGPFGNLSAMYLQRDAEWNNGFTTSSMPANAIILAYTNSSDTNYARTFIHEDKGFMYYGDGSPFSSDSGSQTSNTNVPLKTSNNYTVPQLYYNTNTSGQQIQCNAHFFLNTIAWAVDKVIEKRLYGSALSTQTFQITEE